MLLHLDRYSLQVLVLNGEKEKDMSKILIADDEPQIREILRVYFQKEDFVVVEAEDGQQALSMIGKEKCSVFN